MSITGKRPGRSEGSRRGRFGLQAATAALDRLDYALAVFAAETPTRERVYANQLFEAWFGPVVSEADWRGQFAESSAWAALDAAPGQVDDVIELHHVKTGVWYRARSQTIPLEDAGVGVLLSVSNVNEQMRALNQHRTRQDNLLFNARRMSVGEMATTLAHELNQPLAAIVNYLSFAGSLIPSLTAPPPRLDEAIELARAQARHAADVVARMREFVRAREPRRELHDLAEIITSVLRLLQLEAQGHRVAIEIDVAPAIGKVHIDRVMIEQVLLNLVKNAIEALAVLDPDRRRIRVGVRVNLDDHAEVRVADRGDRLSADEADRAFSPFYTTKAEGMGVGLSICRSIVEYHEGRLFFEPEPDGGNAFVFTLPRHRE